jgi:hypothetical protein
MPEAPQIKINPPRRLTGGALAILSAYGLALMVPVLVAILFVSTLSLGAITLLLPLAVIALVTLFLPFGFGNLYVTRLVRAVHLEAATARNGFVVQLTLTPRLRQGWRALLEDADDLGWLSITDSALEFYGDSIRLSLPFEHIRQLRAVSIGWRGLFLYGPPTKLAVSGLPNIAELQIAERSSCLLPASRATARELYRRLSANLPRK